MTNKIAELEEKLALAERDIVCADMIDHDGRRQMELARTRKARDQIKAELDAACAKVRSGCGRLLYTADDIVHLIGAQPGLQRVYHDDQLGLLSIEHDGTIGWDELQAIKELVWGTEIAAIEVYPPRTRLVNNIAMRHLWKLGADDWWPDLGREGPAQARTLRDRYQATHAATAGVA